ncbi:MAG TPA: hypothetical protein VK932_17465, partial [Kofleriaceae bacterium]|nr:hypothetical protein [Kofleriaceae bacterium]
MRKFDVRSAASALFVALISLGGCMDPESTDSAGSQDELDDVELGSVEQLSYMGDLGVGLGSPVATGSTIGLTNDFTPPCASSSAPDASYTWTAPSTGTYVFSTSGSSFDTILHLRLYNTTISLGCNDDSNGTLQSTVSVNLSAGQTVLAIIDGYGGSQGTYRLNINGGSSIPTGAHLWLRADAGVVLNGSQVSQWLDQSGNGRNGYMPTVSRQPSFVSGALNGKPVLRFNGAQSLILENYATPTTFSVFIVGKNSKPTESFSMILGPAGSAPNNQMRWEDGSRALFVGTGNNLPTSTSSIGNTRVFHALSARYDGATMTVYRDGSAKSWNSFSTRGPWTVACIGSLYSSYFMLGVLG